MKNKIVKLSLVITSIVMMFTILVLNVSADDNIFTGTESWVGEFSTGWTGAEGTLASNSINDFKVDMSSIGHWVDGESRYGAQAKLENKSITMEAGKTYTYTAKIKSDSARKISIFLVNPENDEHMINEGITLPEGEEYNYSAEFTLSSDVNKINMYYFLGWSGDDDLAQDSANKIEVSDISITWKFDLEEYKAAKLNEISNYENPNNSDEIKAIIENAKTNINNATSQLLVDQAYSNFLIQLNLQQAIEAENNQTNNDSNTNMNNNNQTSNIDTTNDKNTTSTTAAKNTTSINDNPLTKDDIILYFAMLLFGVVGLRFINKKVIKN